MNKEKFAYFNQVREISKPPGTIDSVIEKLENRIFYPRIVCTEIAGYRIKFLAETKRKANSLRNFGYEKECIESSLDLLSPGDSFWDIGGEVGKWSLPISLRVGEQGQVLVMEPFADNFNLLQKNITMNQITNICSLQAAAWSSDGSITIHTNLRGKAPRPSDLGSLSPDIDKLPVGIDVLSYRISTLVDSGFEPPKMIKIDVEGKGEEVLRGMGDLRPGYIVYETHPSLGEKIPQLLEEEYDLLQQFHRKSEILGIYKFQED